MYARIVGGTVVSVTGEQPPLGSVECALIVECGPEVAGGWTWTPEGFVAPPPPVEDEIPVEV